MLHCGAVFQLMKSGQWEEARVSQHDNLLPYFDLPDPRFIGTRFLANISAQLQVSNSFVKYVQRCIFDYLYTECLQPYSCPGYTPSNDTMYTRKATIPSNAAYDPSQSVPTP